MTRALNAGATDRDARLFCTEAGLCMHTRRMAESVLEIGGTTFPIIFRVDELFDAAGNPANLFASGFDIGNGQGLLRCVDFASDGRGR